MFLMFPGFIIIPGLITLGNLREKLKGKKKYFRKHLKMCALFKKKYFELSKINYDGYGIK